MKRSIAILFAFILMTVTFAGCSTTDETVDTNVDDQVQNQDDDNSEDDGLWPRTIVDATGAEITIEKQPERVTLIHSYYLEHLLLIDQPPVAAAIGNATGGVELLADSELFAPYIEGLDIIELGSITTLDLEVVLESDPDVIIHFTEDGIEGIYEQLNQIAPVVIVDYTLSWQEELMAIAEIFGKEDEVAQIVEETEQMIAEAKEILQEYSDDTMVLFRTDGKNLIAVSTQEYYDTFGLTMPEGHPSDFNPMSLEAVVEMNPTYIIFQHNYDQAISIVESMESSSVWNSMDAVQNGHIYYFDENMNTNGPLAMRLASEKLVEIFTQ